MTGELRQGTQRVLVSPGSIVTVRSSETFVIYGCRGATHVALLGPATVSHRFCRFRVPDICDHIEVKVKPSVVWSGVEERRNAKEYPDPTPVELPLGHHKPESLEDTMKRFVRDYVGQVFAEQQGMETFEEADDFDVDDPGEEQLFSQYDVEDMVEMEPPPPKEEEASVTPAQTASDETSSSSEPPPGGSQQPPSPAESPKPA